MARLRRELSEVRNALAAQTAAVEKVLALSGTKWVHKSEVRAAFATAGPDRGPAVSVMTISASTRVARKHYRCAMCDLSIRPGDAHYASNNVYDGRIYTWRECVWCHQDGVCDEVWSWAGGFHDEGVNYEDAQEWAPESVRWSTNAITRAAARRWFARAAGGEGE